MSRSTARWADPIIRFATRDRLPAIADFLPALAGPHFAERFPGHTACDFFDWKYFRNPSGEAIVGIAESSGRVVATVAAVPTRLQLDDRIVSAYNLGDFLTATDFRNQGLFSRLIDLVCTEAAARGAALAYVQPNENSYPILSRRGFQEPHRFVLRRFLVPSRILTRKLGIPLRVARYVGFDSLALHVSLPRWRDRSVIIEPATAFDPSMDHFWESARRGYDFLVARDRDRLQWRFADTPTPFRIHVARRGGELAGYIVTFVSRATAEAHIVDLFTHADDRGAAVELLRLGLEDLTREPVKAVYAWTLATPTSSMIDGLLCRALRFTWAPFHFAVRSLRLSASPDLPHERWHLMAGDFDGV